MSPLVTTIHQILSVLTIVGQITIVTLIVLMIISQKKRLSIFELVASYSFPMSFIVALIAMSGSLFYSGVAGFTPCTLCWYQRILMYPHVILLGVALWKEDKRIMDYLIALSTLGVFVSGYHYLLQIGILAPLPCSAIGYSVSCTKTFVMSLGYITIPMMSLTAFLLIVTFMVTKKLSNNRKLNTQ